MTATLALLRTELTLLRRDTTAWSTAVALPFVVGLLWAVNDPPVGDGVGAIIVLQAAMLLIFTLHTVGVMALAARRDQQVLSRWRSSQLRPADVLLGTIGVPAALVVVQAVVLTAITAGLAGQWPANVPALLLGLVSGVAVVGAATFVVAAFTRAPEHAMITTFPGFVVLFVAILWTLGRPLDPFDLQVLAVPGGATMQLLRLGWEGTSGGVLGWLAEVAPSLVASVAYAALGTAAAVRWFRWQPRG